MFHQREDILLVTDPVKGLKLASRPTFQSLKIVNQNLTVVKINEESNSYEKTDLHRHVRFGFVQIAHVRLSLQYHEKNGTETRPNYFSPTRTV